MNNFLQEFRSKYNPGLILDYLDSLNGETPTEQGLMEYQQQADAEYNSSIQSGQNPVMPKRDFDGSDIVGLMSHIR